MTSLFWKTLFAVVCAGVFSGSSDAQTMGAAPAGTVTGHVTCGDTQRAARFAGVMLMGVPKEKEMPLAPDPKAPADAASIKSAMNSVMGGMNLVQTQTGMDGNYVAANVPPGDYYVFVSVPGYIQPAAVAQAALDAGADLSKAIPGVAMVHVVADRSVRQDVTADRGAAVSGTVVWDDGTPVAKAIVTVESPKMTDKKLPPSFAMLGIAGGLGAGGVLAISDDLGHFRISGLSPGEYRVKTTLQVKSQFAMQGGVMNLAQMMPEKPLVVYAPMTMHKADAKTVALKTGEEQRDVLVTIDAVHMRTVSGRVGSAEDHHGINSGTVTLTDASDKDVQRSASVDASGNYTVSFVPAGTYNLTVTDAADTEPSKKKPTGLIRMTMPETVRSYEDGKLSVIVAEADVTGKDVELTPAKKTKPNVDLEDLLKE
jgi:hypothetical protein